MNGVLSVIISKIYQISLYVEKFRYLKNLHLKIFGSNLKEENLFHHLLIHIILSESFQIKNQSK